MISGSRPTPASAPAPARALSGFGSGFGSAAPPGSGSGFRGGLGAVSSRGVTAQIQHRKGMLTAALASLLVLALPQRTEAFYLPGVAPYEYKDSEKVRVPLLCSQRVVGASLHPAAT